MPEVKTIQLHKSAGTCPRCLNKKVINPRWSSSINAAGKQEICLTTYCSACKVHIHQNLFIDGGTQVVWEAPEPKPLQEPEPQFEQEPQPEQEPESFVASLDVEKRRRKK